MSSAPEQADRPDVGGASPRVGPAGSSGIPAGPASSPSQLAFWLWLGGAALLLAALAPVSDFTRPGAPLQFALLGVCASLATFGALARFETLPTWLRPAVFWAAAILLRGLALFIQPGDDLWRYLWEGMIQHHGFNPYLLSPDAPALIPLRTDWWPLINHPDWAAIYPPGTQLFFRAMSAVSLQPMAWKIGFALCDLGTLYLLVRAHTGPRRHRNIAWYAWNPLVIYCLAGAAHFDALLVFLLTAAIWALHRADPMDRGPVAWSWSLLCGLFFGAAIAVKAVPILLLPLWALKMRSRAFALLPGLALPLGLATLYGFPAVDVFANLSTFAARARTNDLLWWALDPLLRGFAGGHNRLALAATAAAALALAYLFRKDWRRGTLWILGAALVLSPVLHPWYLCWVLPVAAWRCARPWFVLAASLFAYFLLLETAMPGDPWTNPPWLRALILVPPLAALLWPRFRQTRACPPA